MSTIIPNWNHMCAENMFTKSVDSQYSIQFKIEGKWKFWLKKEPGGHQLHICGFEEKKKFKQGPWTL